MPDTIFTFDDLNDFFYVNDLVELGNADSELEVLYLLEERGYGDYFSTNDIRKIYDWSYQYCKDHGLIQVWGQA